MTTLDQQRAQNALEKVSEVAGEDYKKEYRSYVRALPMNLRIQGLG